MNESDSGDVDNTTSYPSLYDAEYVYFAEHFVPVTVFLVIILVVGGIGNSLTFFLYFTKFSHSNHRVLVLWLSAVDFLSSVEGIPFVLYDLYSTLTFRNEAFCKIGKLFGVFFPSFSLGLLTFIATVRYWKVCMPFRTGLTTKKSHMICAVVGAIEFLLLAVPALWIYGIKEIPWPGPQTGHDCTISEESSSSTLTTYQRVLNGILFTVSFSVCLIIYILIGRTLIKRSKMCVVDTPTRMANAGDQKQKTNTICKHGNISTIGRHTKLHTIARTGLGKPAKINAIDVFVGKDTQQEESTSSRYPNSDGEYENKDNSDSIVSEESMSVGIQQNQQHGEICDCDCECLYNSEDEDDNMPSSDDDSVQLVNHVTDKLHKTDSCTSTRNHTTEKCAIENSGGEQTPENIKVNAFLDTETNKTEVSNDIKQVTGAEINGAPRVLLDQEKEHGEESEHKAKPADGSGLDKMNRAFSFRVSPVVNRGLERSRRLSIIFLVVTALSFGTCLPFLIFSTVKVFNPNIAIQIAQYANVSSFLTYFYFFNSALNPIVYGFMDSKFRREIRLCCKRIRKRMSRFCKRKTSSSCKYYF